MCNTKIKHSLVAHVDTSLSFPQTTRGNGGGCEAPPWGGRSPQKFAPDRAQIWWLPSHCPTKYHWGVGVGPTIVCTLPTSEGHWRECGCAIIVADEINAVVIFFSFSSLRLKLGTKTTTTHGQYINYLYLSLDNGKTDVEWLNWVKSGCCHFHRKSRTVENRSQHSLVAVRCERILLLPILNLTCVSWIKYMSTPIGAKQYQLKNFFSKKSTADADLRLQARLTLKAR